MSRLSDVLAAARQEGRAALVGYLPAGFPSVQGGIDAAVAMVEAGVDVVELGLPYSDPVMDGPVIQEAVTRALAAGVTPADVVTTVEAVARTGAPTLVMTYWNPIERMGPARFAADLAAAGGAGLILPDLPPEEAGEWRAAAATHGLDSVFVVAPSSSRARLELASAASSGFVYAASLMGVTGVQDVGDAAEALVARTREVTDLPVCVGIGVKTAAHAAAVARYADGVIVGSAFVRAMLDAPDEPSAVVAAARLARDLADGVRAGRARPA